MMRRRINLQREVGERRRMVEMVEGEEAGTGDVLRANAGKQMAGIEEDVAESWNKERDQETMKQRKNELTGR